MHLPPDDIDLWIADLKDIWINSRQHTDIQVRSSAPYLEKAIDILVDYTASRERQQFIPEPRTQKPKIQQEATQKRPNFLEEPQSQEYPECLNGYHLVRRRLRNGAAGFCRKNPQRKKK